MSEWATVIGVPAGAEICGVSPEVESLQSVTESCDEPLGRFLKIPMPLSVFANLCRAPHYACSDALQRFLRTRRLQVAMQASERFELLGGREGF